MRLHYYSALPNFGDRLNPWLWPKLLPGCFEDDQRTVFLGIGTILQASVPDAQRYIVLGSGAGYGPPPQLDERWKFYAVRGPLTARELELPAEIAVTDAAYLLRLVGLPDPLAGPSIGFMPHWRSLRRVPWRTICDWSGLRFIDPMGKVDRVLAELRGCDCVVAEAMHGAITADLLRIPWYPVRLGTHFLDFKWRDWLASIEVSCEALPLTPMDPWSEHQPRDKPVVKAARQAINVVSYYARSIPLVSELRTLRKAIEQKRRRVFLSSDRIVDERTGTLESRLDALRHALAGRPTPVQPQRAPTR